MIAGAFVLTGLSLGRWIDPHWYLLSAFVGLNLMQSAVTGWCPAESVLKNTIFNLESSRNKRERNA